VPGRLAWVAAALLVLPVRAVAQNPVPTPTDTVRADSLRKSHDSTSTDRLLAVEANKLVRIPTLPRLGFGELEPAGSRIILTRDSIEWAPARTVGDLLAHVAPIFLWRGGWMGRSEMPNLLGRGAASVEYLVDGIPYLPIGQDSVAVDPSFWALEFIDRIEIERAPGMLRVFLYSTEHDRLAPRTGIAVSTGDRGYAKYFGKFQRRYASGIGLSLLGDFTSVNAPAGGSGAAGVTNAALGLSWQADRRLGASLRYLIQVPDRDPLMGAGEAATDTLDPGLSGSRSDLQARIAWRDRDDGLGLRADLLAVRTAWRSDSLDETVGTMGVIAGYRRPTWSTELQALHHTEWTGFDSRLAAGWSPARWLSGSLEGVYQTHAGDRVSEFATARLGLDLGRFPAIPLVGLRLPGRLSLGGMARYGDRVQAPSRLADPAQSISDYELRATVAGRVLALEARWASLDAWNPLAYRSFAAIPALARQPRTEWIEVAARLAPTNWLAIASHYEHPRAGFLPDGVPPNHAWTTLTVNSRFLRNFPSGIFRLKVQAVLETWSPGVIGRDAEGAAIAQPGLTFLRGNIQFKIGPFEAYWDRVNFQAVRKGQIPGYPIMSLGSSYGIRWNYDN
jgi:hypothetical protein